MRTDNQAWLARLQHLNTVATVEASFIQLADHSIVAFLLGVSDHSACKQQAATVSGCQLASNASIRERVLSLSLSNMWCDAFPEFGLAGQDWELASHRPDQLAA